MSVSKDDFEELKTRFDKLEECLNTRDQTGPRGGHEVPETELHQGSARGFSVQTADPTDRPEKDLQGQVKSLKDALNSIVLPPELKLNDTRGHSGIKKPDQDAAKIISKCASFTETALKLLGTLSAGTVSEDQLGSLHILLTGMMEYLQDEYSSLIVQGTFPKETVAKFYKNFTKGTSALLPRHREALTTAVNLLGPAASQAPQENRPGDSRPQFRRGTFGARGGGYRGGRRGYRPGGDVFSDTVSHRGFSRPFNQAPQDQD